MSTLLSRQVQFHRHKPRVPGQCFSVYQASSGEFLALWRVHVTRCTACMRQLNKMSRMLKFDWRGTVVRTPACYQRWTPTLMVLSFTSVQFMTVSKRSEKLQHVHTVFLKFPQSATVPIMYVSFMDFASSSFFGTHKRLKRTVLIFSSPSDSLYLYYVVCRISFIFTIPVLFVCLSPENSQPPKNRTLFCNYNYK